MAKRISLPALTPAPGPWSLDWSRIDRDGPFAWPAPASNDFYLLAGYLARLNELSLDEVMALERVHGGSAVHALAEWDLSESAEARWSEIYEKSNLDSEDSPQLDIVTMTYCIKQVDARRVVIALDSQSRIGYPLWWDTKHEVSGSNRDNQPEPCTYEGCHHLPDPQQTAEQP